MRDILEILNYVQDTIVTSGEDHIALSSNDLNVLGDRNQLRALKIFVRIPRNFKASSNIITCIDAIKQGDCIYRTLEYCVLRNHVLHDVPKYITVLDKEYESA